VTIGSGVKSPNGSVNGMRVSIYLPVAIVEEVEHLATEERRSKSQMYSLLLEKSLEKS
jgi:hypothetical protein